LSIPSVAMTKSELRQIFLERRKAFSPAERADKSRRIAELFFTSTGLSETKLLHTFIPLENRNEVDTSLITHEVWSRSPEIEIAVPRVNFKTGEVESLGYTAEIELIENAWGLREPSGGELVDPETIDLVLVPLVCFDERGYRVGYGKGFYDKFLRNCRPACLKIGLSFFPAVDRIDDVHDGDIPLDRCITPERVYYWDAETRNPTVSSAS
jgi:5-formyltetrahydrofolate cyclo-ligase